MSSLRLITDATAEPVSLDDIKLHIGMSATETARDAWFTAVIKASRKLAENKTHRGCLPQTWMLSLDDFSDEMILPIAPVLASSDVSISYLDPTSGNSTTLTTSYYRVDTASEPARVCIGYDQDWPDVYGVKNAVSITFKAGYDTTGTPTTDTCPEAIETWIKMRVAGLYEMKESHSDKPVQEMAHSFVDGLLDPYVLIEVSP